MELTGRSVKPTSNAGLLAPPPTGRMGPAANQEMIRSLRVLFSSPLTVFGFLLLLLFTVASAWPVSWLPHDPYLLDLSLRFIPPAWQEGGQAAYPLGTDSLGRDIVSMIIHGSRSSFMVVSLSGSLALIVGLAAGLIAGYRGGLIDDLLMRLVDIQLAFPLVVLVIAIVAALGPSLFNLVLVLAISGWAPFARIVRGSVLSVREKEFVHAAHAIGAPDSRIILRHVLPNIGTPLIIFTTFDLARLLLLEASLSFLGLGVQPPTPSLGSMIADGRQYIFEAWWASALPGMVILLAVLACNFIGDGLRDMLDPRSRQG